MHNIKSTFDKILCVLRQILDEKSSILKKEVKPGPKTKFSDLEVIALACTAECMGYDSENYFFSHLNPSDFPGLLSRRQFNDRRKMAKDKFEEVRKLVLSKMKTEKKVCIVDSMPLRLCRISRRNRIKIAQEDNDIKPNIGYCASQEERYFGFKFHAVCSVEGVLEFFDITSASYADVNYLDTVAKKLKNAHLIGDKGYISQYHKELLREESKVHIFTDSRVNAKKITLIPVPYKGKRKKIETLFSQLADQFNIQRNYSKSFLSYSTRILSKVTGMTILNFINQLNGKPKSQIKYALI